MTPPNLDALHADTSKRRDMRVSIGLAMLLLGIASWIGWPAPAHAQPSSSPLWSRAVAPTDCYFESVPHDAFHLAPEDGVTTTAADGLQRIAADGTTLWQVSRCPTCTAPPSALSHIVDTSLAAAPDTWIVAADGGGSNEPPRAYALHRIDSTGAVTDSAPLLSVREAQMRILADASGVTGLIAAYPSSELPGLRWIRYEPGSALVERTVPVGTFALGLSVEALWAAPGGGVLAAVEHQELRMCMPGHPCNTTRQLLLLRFDVQGGESWRVQVDGFVPRIAMQADGSAWLAHRSPGVARMSAQGVLSPILPVEGLLPDEEIFSIHGPVAGHLLLVTYQGLRLLDLGGRIVASRMTGPNPNWQSASLDNLLAIPGFFLLPTQWGTDDCTVAQLLDPRTLDVRRVLRDDVACPLYSFSYGDARVHDDGSVYVSGVVRGDACSVDSASGSQIQLMRFGLPGTPAGGLLFRDGFGP